MNRHVPVAHPSISVIVPAYNAAGTIDRCLSALARQTVPRECYEIIVVDDGSSDDTSARVQEHDCVELLTQARAGPALARNRGVQHGRGEIVLFTDADCEPSPDWIERMVAPFHPTHIPRNGPATRVNGTFATGTSSEPAPIWIERLESISGNGHIAGVKGSYLTRQREVMARFVQAEYEDKYDHMAHEQYIDFVDTYAAGYRRDVFVANGGFDARFPLPSVEDQEFSFRLAEQGYKMAFVPEAQVYHWGHARDLWAYCRRKFGVGYWKVLVLRRYPDKLWHDSHTPQILKVQILVTGLAMLALGFGFLWPPLWWAAGFLAQLFLLTSLPFVRKVWAKDPLVALLSPALLLVRALALGSGFLAGLVAGLVSSNTSQVGGDG